MINDGFFWKQQERLKVLNIINSVDTNEHFGAKIYKNELLLFKFRHKSTYFLKPQSSTILS